MTLALGLLSTSGIFYSFSFLFHLLSFFSLYLKGNRAAFAFMRAGFLLATLYLVAEAIDRGFFLPVVNFSQAIAFIAWALAFVYLVLLVRLQNESFGLIVSPILLLLTLVAMVKKWGGTEGVTLNPVFHNPYFALHIFTAFFAYASFALSFAAGVLYLIQYRELKAKHPGEFYRKLPSLEELERLIYQPLLWGVPLLLTALLIGFVWSKAAYGEFWILDPKTVATGISLALYFVVLYLHYVSSLRGKQVALLSLLAFAFVVASFVGTRFMQGAHNHL